jgi:6-phosphogluconolactonase
MTPARGELMVVETAEAFAEAGARLFADAAAAAQGRFVAGLAGGSTPKSIYRRLAEPPYRTSLRWDAMDLVPGDERFVAHDSPDSNLHMIRGALIDRLDHPVGGLHAVPFEGLTVDRAAAAYEQTLKDLYGHETLRPEQPFFDICFLGMGDDGHTASLLPGQPDLLDERQRWVLPVTKGRPESRVTLTYPVLESSRVVVFVVSGEGKRAMLDAILSGRDTTVPAARLQPQGRLLWLADRAAAGRWAS